MLRSIRYGEADRILHLYTAERGRVNAIAKGSRQPKSRFGGRLEPFFRLDLMLHEGRSDLCTVTGASTIDGYPRLRSDGPAIDAAARACDAVLRLLDSVEPNRPAYNLLCRYLALLDRQRRPEGGPAAQRPARPSGSRSGSSWRSPPASRPSSPPAPAAARRRGSSPSRAPPAGSSAAPARPAGSRSPPRPTGSWSRRSAARSPSCRDAPGAAAAPGRARHRRHPRAPRPRATSAPSA